jgi:hypothetical protein
VETSETAPHAGQLSCLPARQPWFGQMLKVGVVVKSGVQYFVELYADSLYGADIPDVG